MAKKISQVKYAICIGSTVILHSIRTRRKDCLYDWQRENDWEEDKACGYKCLRIRITEEA